VNLIRLHGWVSVQNSAKPNSWSDPWSERGWGSSQGVRGNWGSLVSSAQSAARETQEETQGRTKRCKVADESVVVTKSRPEKAGNSLEEKTGTTRGMVRGGCQVPKALTSCEGRKFILRNRNENGCNSGHKPPDGAGHFSAEDRDGRSGGTGRPSE